MGAVLLRSGVARGQARSGGFDEIGARKQSASITGQITHWANWAE